jgi:hypothetical protein
MTKAQRKLLEKFAALGEKPLNRAIRAALDEIDRLGAENGSLKASRGGFRRLIRNLRREHEENGHEIAADDWHLRVDPDVGV